jgi:hypothetical protein
MEAHLAILLTPHEAHGKSAAQLAACRLVANPAEQACAQHMQLAHGALQAKQQSFVEHGWAIDAVGARKKRVRKLPRSQWSVLLPNHHEGFIDWNTRAIVRGSRPTPIRDRMDERIRLLALGADLLKVWQAPTTSPRDRKELLRTLLEEVIITVYKDERRAHLMLRWRGGTLTDLNLDLPRPRPAIVRTDEDTIALVRRLTAHYPDAVIAGILNRQDRKSAYSHRFTVDLVGNLR